MSKSTTTLEFHGTVKFMNNVVEEFEKSWGRPPALDKESPDTAGNERQRLVSSFVALLMIQLNYHLSYLEHTTAALMAFMKSAEDWLSKCESMA